ncbi:hypothetical protein Q3G72_018235 [Acer saccharum]|nr:hypothetical protein Q3G72_018235 [Acer saccharum]
MDCYRCWQRSSSRCLFSLQDLIFPVAYSLNTSGIQKVERELLNSSKDYKYQIYLEPLVKSFSKDKFETKLKHAKYNVILISDLTKRIKKTGENKNKKEKNKKKYIDIFVWVNAGSGICADDEAKAEDIETEIDVFDDDKAKVEEVKNSVGEQLNTGGIQKDKLETKLNRAKYNVIPISDLTKRIEETGENKNKKEKNKKKYIDVFIGVNAESGVCADDEAKADEVDTEIGDCAADDKATAKEIDTKIGVFWL